MNRKEKMKQLKEKGLSYGSIGELFGISRQRAHQLVSGYIGYPNKSYGVVIRYSIFKRDNFKCQICEKKGTLIHHIDKNNLNNNPNNLVCLCNKCHLNFHRPNEITDEGKRRISESHKGIKLSEEHKRKISIYWKGKRKGKNNPFFGKHHSEETKRKMRKTRKKLYT